jgi:hypothetical protein
MAKSLAYFLWSQNIRIIRTLHVFRSIYLQNSLFIGYFCRKNHFNPQKLQMHEFEVRENNTYFRTQGSFSGGKITKPNTVKP